MDALQPLGILLMIAAGITAFILVVIFIAVPIFKGIGWLIGAIIRGIGWLVAHIFEFIAGMISDAVRFIGAIIATVVFLPLSLLNVVIGRWSAAGHFAEAVKRECKVGAMCVYRLVLRRPLKLVMLHGLLEGLEQRVPEAVAAAPTADRPSRRTGNFDGYTIVGSLRGGGSGAKLYIAEPDAGVRSRYPNMPERVVIKSFALAEGSSLPQIVRESRALECARQLGLVFDHGMDERRFFYVMPYHPGDHLGIVTRQLHAETGGNGLGRRQLDTAMRYVCDLVRTLSLYHHGGLWHKDVKPENVIIHDGRAHLVDLGLVTPLRSAMTLTTHGTEYFRDPEMVRQALRGVKVHQVNGEKFDIFAAGAVLYFVIENDFPPHGAMSRFTRRSPEALKWIVRRAMADYHHRYEQTDDMLSDLQYVAASADPFAVKPAELPSMTGRKVDEPEFAAAETAAASEAEAEPAVASASKAGSPVPPKDAENAGGDAEPRGWGFYAGPEGVKFGRIGGSPKRPDTAGPPKTGPGRRPRLRVTNWWTGAYEVLDPGTAARQAAENARHQARVAREQASAYRQDAADIRRQVQAGVMTARRAAREQVRAARARAHEIRRKTKHKRPRAVAERQPSGALLAIGFIAICAIVGALFLTFSRSGRNELWRAGGGSTAVVIDPGPHPQKSLPAILLVTDGVDPDDPRVQALDDRYASKGYKVVREPRLAEGAIGRTFGVWKTNRDNDVLDEQLEDLLAQHNLYGVLDVVADDRPGSQKIRDTLIYSERKGAKQRRYAGLDAPLRPILLVNDHPTRHDDDVRKTVGEWVKKYEAQGWRILRDDDLEAVVRTALPATPQDVSQPMPDLFDAVLADAGLDGILYIYAPPGEGPAKDRIGVRQIISELLPPPRPEAPEPQEISGSPSSSTVEFKTSETRLCNLNLPFGRGMKVTIQCD